MTRQTAAERALRSQITRLEEQINVLNQEAEILGIRIRTLTDLKDQMENELFDLTEARRLK